MRQGFSFNKYQYKNLIIHTHVYAITTDVKQLGMAEGGGVYGDYSRWVTEYPLARVPIKHVFGVTHFRAALVGNKQQY